MIKLSVLIDLFFTELPFPARVAQIKQCGFDAIETWQGAKPEAVAAIGKACKEAAVAFTSVVINGPGDATLAPCNPDTSAAFLERVDRCSDTALAAGCHSGIVTSGNELPPTRGDRQRQLAHFTAALAKAGELAKVKDFRLNIEPLNTVVDHRGQLLSCREDALQALKQVNLANVRMLYDFYHMQIMHGNHTAFIAENATWIGHFHLAGVPGRHEPSHSELNSRFLLENIPANCPATHCGLEYKPTTDHSASLEAAASAALWQ